MKKKEKKILKLIKQASLHPLTMKDIIECLKIPPGAITSFTKIIKKMISEGKLIAIKGNKYGIPEKMNLITGILQGHPDGYGFVLPEEEGEKDIFIKNKSLTNAMHGDKVVCRVESERNNKREGSIIRILERAHKVIVGKFEPSRNFGFVIPEEKRISQDIFIPLAGNKLEAKKGQIVLAEIERYPSKNRNPDGKIIKVLGFPSDPDVEIEIVVRKFNLNTEFTKKTIKEVDSIPQKIPTEEIDSRLDLRKEKIFTVDGENAKDFDDAISIKLLENNNFQLGVHIADVSYYVNENSTLDKEAYARATSVYFPDRVLPMLPFPLSNNLCSLKPKEDRLTLSAIIEIDCTGKIIGYKIINSIIKSMERLTYTDVSSILKNTAPELNQKYSHILNDLKLMEKLCGILRKKRLKDGSIDFDLPEPYIILDITGKTENIIKIERNIAHRIIEEFMLTANKTVAQYIYNSKIPSIYRVHEKPKEEKVINFNTLIQSFGYSLTDIDNIQPKDFQLLLSKVKDKDEEKLINSIMLRTMKQAKYSTNNIGHFGLAFDCYTHFTSPIRRYPDLIIHRLLKKIHPKKPLPKKNISLLEETLPEMSSHTSEMERNAEEAERDIVNLKKVQFMEDKVGEEFIGYISGVTSFGIFVELGEYFVEGLIHVSSMTDDYYDFIEKDYCMFGKNTKKTFRIGDKINVEIISVSIFKREIELKLKL